MTDGLVMLAHQATKGLSIRTRVVYAQDDWEYEEGLSPIMRHKPNPAADHSGRAGYRHVCDSAASGQH